jgi:hypothetical protein
MERSVLAIGIRAQATDYRNCETALTACGRNLRLLKFSGRSKTRSFSFNNLQEISLKFSGPGISAMDS